MFTEEAVKIALRIATEAAAGVLSHEEDDKAKEVLPPELYELVIAEAVRTHKIKAKIVGEAFLSALKKSIEEEPKKEAN